MLHISIKTPPAPSNSRCRLLFYAGGPFYTNAPGEKERGKRREKGKERRKKEKTKRKEKRREEQIRNGPFLKRIAYFTTTPGCVILAAARISDAFWSRWETLKFDVMTGVLRTIEMMPKRLSRLSLFIYPTDSTKTTRATHFGWLSSVEFSSLDTTKCEWWQLDFSNWQGWQPTWTILFWRLDEMRHRPSPFIQ